MSPPSPPQTPRKPPAFLTEPEVEALLEQINPNTTTGLRDRALVAVILGAGLTVSEVVRLTGKDIKLERAAIHVHHTTAHRDREAPVDQEALRWLREWARKRESLGLGPGAPLFCGIRTLGAALDARAVRYTITRLAAKAGVGRPVGPHTLRHTCAMRLLRRGIDIRQVQELLGHSDVSTTMAYLRSAETAPTLPAVPTRGLLPPSRHELGERLADLKQQIAELERLLGR